MNGCKINTYGKLDKETSCSQCVCKNCIHASKCYYHKIHKKSIHNCVNKKCKLSEYYETEIYSTFNSKDIDIEDIPDKLLHELNEIIHRED